MIDPAWQAVRRLLVVRLDNLGDVLLMTPAFHAIRSSLPQASLTLLASPVGAQAGRLTPDIDRVITYRSAWMDPWKQLPQDLDREDAIIATLRQEQFDGAIIFTSYRQSPLPAAYLCYLAGIPLRLGATFDGCGSLLTTRHVHPDRPMHEVERGLDLVGAIGVGTAEADLVLRVPEEARHAAREFLAGLSRPLIVLHPGCSMPARTYPWELYARAADLLAERLGATILLTGDASERPLTRRLGARMTQPAIDLAGRLPFATFCALIEAADLTLTNNTGPMHLSAALKTPVVALFALTNRPEQWGPWHVPHRQLFHQVPCRLCYAKVCPHHQECLRLVTPETVLEAAAELLDAVALGGAA